MTYETVRYMTDKPRPQESGLRASLRDLLGLNPDSDAPVPTLVEEDFLSEIPRGATRIAENLYRIPGEGTYQMLANGRVRFFHDEKTGRYTPLQRVIHEEIPNAPRREPVANIGLLAASEARA